MTTRTHRPILHTRVAELLSSSETPHTMTVLCSHGPAWSESLYWTTTGPVVIGPPWSLSPRRPDAQTSPELSSYQPLKVSAKRQRDVYWQTSLHVHLLSLEMSS